MLAASRAISRSTTAIAVVDARAIVSFVVVNLLSLVLILSTGAALLRGT